MDSHKRSNFDHNNMTMWNASRCILEKQGNFFWDIHKETSAGKQKIREEFTTYWFSVYHSAHLFFTHLQNSKRQIALENTPFNLTLPVQFYPKLIRILPTFFSCFNLLRELTYCPLEFILYFSVTFKAFFFLVRFISLSTNATTREK